MTKDPFDLTYQSKDPVELLLIRFTKSCKEVPVAR